MLKKLFVSVLALGIVSGAYAEESSKKESMSSAYRSQSIFYGFWSAMFVPAVFSASTKVFGIGCTVAASAPAAISTGMLAASTYYAYKWVRPSIPVQSFNPRDWYFNARDWFQSKSAPKKN